MAIGTTTPADQVHRPHRLPTQGRELHSSGPRCRQYVSCISTAAWMPTTSRSTRLRFTSPRARLLPQRHVYLGATSTFRPRPDLCSSCARSQQEMSPSFSPPDGVDRAAALPTSTATDCPAAQGYNGASPDAGGGSSARCSAGSPTFSCGTSTARPTGAAATILGPREQIVNRVRGRAAPTWRPSSSTTRTTPSPPGEGRRDRATAARTR